MASPGLWWWCWWCWWPSLLGGAGGDPRCWLLAQHSQPTPYEQLLIWLGAGAVSSSGGSGLRDRHPTLLAPVIHPTSSCLQGWAGCCHQLNEKRRAKRNKLAWGGPFRTICIPDSSPCPLSPRPHHSHRPCRGHVVPSSSHHTTQPPCEQGQAAVVVDDGVRSRCVVVT
jgi:hypothetical protein